MRRSVKSRPFLFDRDIIKKVLEGCLILNKNIIFASPKKNLG